MSTLTRKQVLQLCQITDLIESDYQKAEAHIEINLEGALARVVYQDARASMREDEKRAREFQKRVKQKAKTDKEFARQWAQLVSDVSRKDKAK